MTGSAAGLKPHESTPTEWLRAEPASFAEIYDGYFRRIWSYVRYRVESAATADDVTSTVFERVLARRDSFDPGRGEIGAWLFAIARNAVADHRRARGRRRWLKLEAIGDVPDPSPSPHAAIERRELIRAVLAAMREMGERDRDVMGLKFGGGLSNLQIGDLTGLSHGNVAVILFRAVRRLRGRMVEGGWIDE